MEMVKSVKVSDFIVHLTRSVMGIIHQSKQFSDVLSPEKRDPFAVFIFLFRLGKS